MTRVFRRATEPCLTGETGQPETDDLQLMERLVERDEHALNVLFDRYGGLVFAVCRRVLRDDHEAEQVLVDVFYELWDRSDRFDARRACPKTYLVMLAQSRAIDRRRVAGRHTAQAETASATPPSPDEESPAEAAEQAEDARRVHTALGELAQGERRAVELAFFDGLTHQEISKEMDAPLGTVKTWIRRGLLKLRDALVLRDGGQDQTLM